MESASSFLHNIAAMKGLPSSGGTTKISFDNQNRDAQDPLKDIANSSIIGADDYKIVLRGIQIAAYHYQTKQIKKCKK